ncbi:hypothetical protein [Pseudothauera rhizosphaerae]|uniref:Uncharacterized protein n=1 Tax=Pseudothauera rhizosphaerae TaxID=2565932 RepID=A0A4S4ACM3_9RHOO|nr:hypothetical protein [Pseudothauera rhizosphaerae]THF55920.1 hypothetical protein E6O51_20250 [Pseudothauera rhizosphaerae]
MSYDDPNFQIRRERYAGEAGGSATTEYGKFRSFQKIRLKAVHAVVTVAGTATTHKLDILHGTTSIGAIALSTSTAGVKSSSTTLDRSVGSLEAISVKSGADATGKADVIYEYEVLPDAVQT